MIRKLALAVALAAGTLPLTALGLGLGDIKTHSALNQNFNADIQLLSVPVGELDGVKVSLGSNKAFNRAGVERPFFLTRLRFETVRNEDGTATIRVTSREPIREPFLDFLIEVNWPKGSMVKEYTVLLDPPTTTARRAPVVTPTRTVRSTPTPTRSAAPSRPAPATAMATAGQYGPVAPNETMWKIADRIRPQGVSVHQMMMALQEANPSAFINGNINLLKQGSILRIPETSSIAAIDNRQAASDFQQQTREWLSGTSAPVVKDRETTPTDTDTAPVASVSRPGATASDEAQLKIATADGTADSGVGAGTEGMSQDLMTAQEEAETARQSAEALEGEVGDLKSQVEDLQRLLALKDQQLAQLQSNIASDSAVDDADSMAGDSAAADDVEQAADTEMMASDTEAAAPEGGDVEGGDEPVVEEPAAVVEAPQQAVAEEPAAQPAMAAEAERSWLDRNLPLVMLGGFGGLIGIGALFAYSRRNKYEEEQWEKTKLEMEESMLLADTQDVESVLSEIVDIDEVANAGDTSFLSEYSTEELKGIHEDTGEADPLSEADVYIAYGRYQQAQELLASAMQDEPGNTAIKHKMLEIYYATQNKDAFFDLAGEMVSAGEDKSDLPAWEQVAVMGRDLDASNPLFGGDVGEGAEVDETMNLSELAEQLDSSLSDDTQLTESVGLETVEIGGSRINEDTEEVSDTVQLGDVAGGAETELHTEMQDASVLTEFADAGALDDELAELEGDLDELMDEDSFQIDGETALDEVAKELDDIAAGDTIVREEGEIEGGTAGLSELTEPTTEIEVETKLELAQAYIDMGDEEGAKEIISEIVSEGTEAQVAKAQELRTSLEG